MTEYCYNAPLMVELAHETFPYSANKNVRKPKVGILELKTPTTVRKLGLENVNFEISSSSIFRKRSELLY